MELMKRGGKNAKKRGAGGGGAKAWSFDAPALSDGRGLPAGGLRSEEIGRVTKKKEQARKNKSKGTARKVSDRTRNHEPPRPGDCDCQLESKELAIETTAPVTVRTPMCTGP